MPSNSNTKVGKARQYGAVLKWLLVIGTGVALPASAAYVVRLDGQRVDGSDIRLKPTGEVVLTTARGQLFFGSGQYRQAVADKPSDYDKALRLVNSRKYDEAIPLLNGLIERLHGLYWDEPAGVLLIQSVLAKGDGAAAVLAYDRLVTANPALAEKGDIQDVCRQALIAAKQYNRLDPLLKKALASPSRPDAARAQMAYGDLHAAQNRLEEAAMDYLRTALLFRDVKTDGELQAEALLKAGETLQKMRDERGAQQCWQELIRLYPSSRAADKASKK